tara:strand:- start:1137 stop:1868 length:732 start_codon:yes stop_codon:yes gene_type:complete
LKILVLGHTGMLGHMVCKYLSTMGGYELKTIDCRWPSTKFLNDISNFDGNFVINCIASIPQRSDNFEINYELPIWLDKNLSCNVIHPGTDGELGNDYYGISKQNASDYITIDGKRTKIIKASLIGPEICNKVSLMEWFLNTNEKNVQGYDKFYWNGITTLQWSKICYSMINDFDNYDILNIPTSDRVSKYELLKIIKSVFNKKIKLSKNLKIEVNRCLEKTHDMPNINIKTQLEELKEFYYGN